MKTDLQDPIEQVPTPPELSIIKLFNYVKKAIEKLDTPPLTKHALEINTDAYAEIGDGTSEGVVFARIGVDFPKKYTDLPFSMIFSEEGVALAVGGMDYVFSEYEEIGDDEKQIATKIVNILIGLANGQLAVLNTITQDDEKTQAWEILYRQPGKQLYDAQATYAVFDSERKLKNKELITQKFANTADIKEVDVDIEAYKQFTFETNWLNKFNRQQIAGLHVPLTRKDWEASVDTYYDKKADDIVKKVDAWATKDKRSVWQQTIDAAQWRHIELTWWAVALLAYKSLSEWSLAHVHPGLIVFIILLLAATLFRNNELFLKFYTYIRFIAYGIFAGAGFVYVGYSDNSFWWVALGVVALVSLAENIGFDIHMVYKKLRR